MLTIRAAALTEILEADWERAVVDVEEGYSILPAGLFPRHFTEHDIATMIRTRLAVLSEFDYVLIDVPTHVLEHERRGVCQGSTGVLLVVDAGQTRGEVLERLGAEWKRDGVSVTGVVLNNRRYPIPEMLYRLAA
jgi:Mrp family chromosome partitioning ATPase